MNAIGIRAQLKITGVIVASLLAACGSDPRSEADHDHAHEGSSYEEVHLIQKQMDVMDIQLGQFQFLDLSKTIKTNGQLELPPQNKASLGAVMEGRVRSIEVLEGDRVSKGQVLAYLEHPNFIELQEDYMEIHSQLEFLEKDYERKKALHADSITSTKSFQDAEADYKTAKAQIHGLTAKLEMLGLDVEKVEKGEMYISVPVRSPIDGYVRLIEVNIGRYVQPEEEMFEIVDNDHIHIDLWVYEKDMAKVRNGQKVLFSLANDPDSLFEGSVFAIGRSFEQEPKAMIVHAEIDNVSGDLLPGMYVDARIIIEHSSKAMALPNEAIVHNGGLDHIFILQQDPDRTHNDHSHDHSDEFVFKPVEVNKGASDIGFTEVVPADDIPRDAMIVVKGAYYLLAEMKKGEGGHGHHHK